jgi:hypothetical protein
MTGRIELRTEMWRNRSLERSSRTTPAEVTVRWWQGPRIKGRSTSTYRVSCQDSNPFILKRLSQLTWSLRNDISWLVRALRSWVRILLQAWMFMCMYSVCVVCRWEPWGGVNSRSRSPTGCIKHRMKKVRNKQRPNNGLQSCWWWWQ